MSYNGINRLHEIFISDSLNSHKMQQPNSCKTFTIGYWLPEEVIPAHAVDISNYTDHRITLSEWHTQEAERELNAHIAGACFEPHPLPDHLRDKL